MGTGFCVVDICTFFGFQPVKALVVLKGCIFEITEFGLTAYFDCAFDALYILERIRMRAKASRKDKMFCH